MVWIIFGVLLFLFFIVSVLFFLKIMELKRTKQSLNEAKLYNKTLEHLYDDVRSFRHDFFNILQSIDGYIKTNDISALGKYYKDLKRECAELNSMSMLSPKLIDDPGIYTLISSKFYKAREAGVFFDVHITAKVSQIAVSPYVLSRVLGVLLDNAIEAAKDSFEKTVSLEIVNVFDRIDVIVQNSYADKDIDVDKIFEKGFSSKAKDTSRHGLGLWKVKELLKLYKNLNLVASKDLHWFKQVLEIR